MKTGAYSDIEIDFIKREYPTKGLVYCAKHLGRNPKSVQTKAAKMGIKVVPGHKGIDFSLFESGRSPELAYTLGLLWADSHIHHYVSNGINYHHTRLEIASEDAKDIAPTISAVVQWSSRERHRDPRWKPTTVFNKNSRPLFELLESLGFGRKTKAGPHAVLDKLCSENHYLFWRGFFDGDGCLSFGHNRKVLSFCGPINTNWNTLLGLYEKLGITPCLSKEDNAHGKCSKVLIQNIKGVRTMLNYLYPEDSYLLGFRRKFNLAKQFISMTSGH